MDLLNVVQTVTDTRKDNDYTDRFNHTYTAIMLVLFSVVVTAKQYVGEPIDCWCPAQFTDNYIRYTNNICWVKNTYYVPMNNTVPETDFLDKPQLRYYQWVPFILLSLGLLYQIPCYIWRGNNESSGLNIENILNLSNMNVGTIEEKDNNIKLLTKHFERYLEMRKRWTWTFQKGVLYETVKIFFFWTGRKYGNYLSGLYIFTKTLYLVNTILQLFLIDILLSGGIHFYGARLFDDFVSGKISRGSNYFPRITLCDFHIREIGFEVVGHRYTVQCVLSINLFSEAIFTFYWFWLVLLILFNVISFSKWIYYIFVPTSSVAYVRRHIRSELFHHGAIYSAVEDFVHNYLKSDGVFALRLISQNSNDLVVTDLVSALYENYRIRKNTN